MTVKELKKLLERFPDDCKVVLSGELGASEISKDQFRVTKMIYCRYLDGSCGWEFPGEYVRTVLAYEDVLVLSG